MKHVKIFESFSNINEAVDKYKAAHNARDLYDLCQSYNVDLLDAAKLFKDPILSEYLNAILKLDLTKFSEGDVVEILDGKHKGKIGEIDRYQSISDYLGGENYQNNRGGIGVYVSKLNPNEASSITLAKTWSEVPSSSLVKFEDLKLIKKKKINN